MTSWRLVFAVSSMSVLGPELRRCSSSNVASTSLPSNPTVGWLRSRKAKGIPIEIADFEQWQPAGRQFDRVVFAASFHWVDPAVALPKIREILGDGGKLAMIWNRLRPTRPTRAEFESIYKDYMDIDARGSDGEPGALTALLTDSDFTVMDRRYPHHLHYSRQEWVDVTFTFSNHLTFAADKATELRAKMAKLIGPSGVSVGGDALAILATPDRSA